MIFFNFLLNPLNVFLTTTGEDIKIEDVFFFLVWLILIPYVVMTSLLWAGGFGFISAVIAGIVIWLFWLTGNSRPVFGSVLLAGLLAIAENEPLPVLYDIGWKQAMVIDTWLNQMSFSATVLALTSIYFVFTWPLTGLRQAIVGK